MTAFQTLSPQPHRQFLDDKEISECSSVREAFRLAWKRRVRPNMKETQLAEELGISKSLVSRYLNKTDFDEHGNKRSNLPIDLVDEVERILGNKAISQWMARKGGYTIMEEVIAKRAA
jgi:predicted transcriptional regulator